MIRRQLSLYVGGPEAGQIDALRAVLDPVQYALIPAHATLARDEDLGLVDAAELDARLRSLRVPALRLRFGPAEAFHGHGILLACVEGQAAFEALRTRLLGRTQPHQPPHLTLAHPRNPRADGNSLALARARLPARLELRFDTLNLIEQRDAGRWQILHRVLLH